MHARNADCSLAGCAIGEEHAPHGVFLRELVRAAGPAPLGLRELSPEQARAMTQIDQRHHVAFAARPLGSRAIVADARYVLRADSGDAEFAVAVADAWQGAGLGRALLLRLAAHARAHGLRRLFGDVLWGNTPMIGLARARRDAGAPSGRRDPGAGRVRVRWAGRAGSACANIRSPDDLLNDRS
jgi:GNAT superfamily N-acetyltransferase